MTIQKVKLLLGVYICLFLGSAAKSQATREESIWNIYAYTWAGIILYLVAGIFLVRFMVER